MVFRLPIRKMYWVLKKTFLLVFVGFAFYGMYVALYKGADYCVLLNMKEHLKRCDCEDAVKLQVKVENKDDPDTEVDMSVADDIGDDGLVFEDGDEDEDDEEEAVAADQDDRIEEDGIGEEEPIDVNLTYADEASDEEVEDKAKSSSSVFAVQEEEDVKTEEELIEELDVDDLKNLEVTVEEKGDSEVVLDETVDEDAQEEEEETE